MNFTKTMSYSLQLRAVVNNSLLRISRRIIVFIMI